MSRPGPVSAGSTRRLAGLALTICCALGAFGAVAAGTPEIYRCDGGDSTVFSDVPCSDSAEIHQPRNGISVVRAADGLESVSEQNREFIAARRQQIAERRARTERIREQAAREQRAAAATRRQDQRAVIWSPGWSRQPAFDASRARPPDRRTRASQRGEGDESVRELRRSLLSRSGGNGPILRARQPPYQ